MPIGSFSAAKQKICISKPCEQGDSLQMTVDPFEPRVQCQKSRDTSATLSVQSNFCLSESAICWGAPWKRADKNKLDARLTRSICCASYIPTRSPISKIWMLKQCVNVLSSLVQQEETQSSKQHLKSWRDSVLGSDATAGEWVKRRAVAACAQDALKLLRNYWAQIWERDLTFLAPAVQMFSALGRTQPTACLNWKPFDARELSAQAWRLRAFAPGIDGWSGSEFCDWPHNAWLTFAHLANHFVKKGSVPSAFKDCRLIFLFKEGSKRDANGNIPCEQTRPIAVQSILWRLLASSFVKRLTTRTWILGWAPKNAFGSIAGRGVQDAISKLEAAFRKAPDNVLVSLDFQKCFDHIHPQLAATALEAMGAPVQLVNVPMYARRNPSQLILAARRCALTFMLGCNPGRGGTECCNRSAGSHWHTDATGHLLR